MRACRAAACAALALALAVVPGCAADGAEAPDGLAFELSETRDVGCMLQLPDYPTGCEVVSLVNALHAFGVEASFDEAYALFDKSDHDYVHAWWGDPYGGGGAAYPPAMEEAANRALIGTSYRADDVTGCGLQGIADCVQAGGVIVAWVTTDMESPVWSGWEVDGWPMYANEHCVVVYGLSNGDVLVSDPLRGLVPIPLGEWYAVWDSCGQMAVSIS